MSYFRVLFVAISGLACFILRVHAQDSGQSGTARCVVPSQFQGDWFSMERGDDVNTLINAESLENNFFFGYCAEVWNDNTTTDALNATDSKILFYNTLSKCYQCYYLMHRTLNIVQYKFSDCQSSADDYSQPSLSSICSTISENTEMWTFFRKTLITVNCKNTFEGTYQFSYEWNEGGAGICDSKDSQIIACQEPGSPYVDNEVFKMNFDNCPDVQNSVYNQIKFQCMGTWKDEEGNVWSGVADLGEEIYRERFHCMLTRYDQEDIDNRRRYSMSWWAECSTLKSPYEGPVRLIVTPTIGGYQQAIAEPGCSFPTNYSGTWFYMGEYNVHARINMTHIHFKALTGQYEWIETYFVCLNMAGTRYLTVAITVGKCEIDYVCWDMLPRRHSLIQWRQSKPYRLTEVELSYPDFQMYMFRQACTWNSFTIDRKHVDWKYETFLLNPPDPIPCPIRGRYEFVQEGQENEKYKTRIMGITENPRHMIDCLDYSALVMSCDENPTKLKVDAEYCETVDHTGRPVGEYDMPDWEHTCIGYWKEDWKFHMITWDPTDAMSPFRCWVYERMDWRHVQMSRSTTAHCWATQTSTTSDPDLGGSLALKMVEAERQYDDCSMMFVGDDPTGLAVYELGEAFSTAAHTSPSFAQFVCICLAITVTSGVTGL